MKNRNSILTTTLLVLYCFAVSPVAQARRPSEDRGNGNSAAENVDALNLSTTGSNNTAHGWFSLYSNTGGSSNTADGFQALLSNTTGANNTADGFQALFSNTTGNSNTADGFQALFSNTTGSENTANGFQALFDNTEGNSNTATGVKALFSNTIGIENTAVGFQALVANTTRDSNTAVGSQALFTNTTGTGNTAVGAHALLNNVIGADNIAVGVSALAGATGSLNIGVGDNAGANVTTANNVICIGSFGANVSDSCFIGNIFGTAISGLTVFINGDGQLGTAVSSRRFKDDIRPMDTASKAILALRPVTFRYKKEIDPAGASQFGLVAEEVEKVNPDLVVRDKEGKPYSVRYDQVNVMLLNEFLKEHKKVQELKSTAATQNAAIAGLKSTVVRQEATITQQRKDFRSVIAQQQKGMEVLTAQLKEQAAQIQKVSAQLQISRPVLKTVLNNQ